ncbi:MAG TPA: L-histidine N(alpha)-methyltransferase, partial [Chthoniobacterales bacterium]|nr:L-histidine N(alpha)-methyltransferase [Chthoniobacterales bacterium]
MKILSDPSPSLHDFEPSTDRFFDELFVGLSRNPKSIPSKFFYDKTGCELFDQICCLEEYYPTRTEMLILRDNVAEICTLFGPECRLVELGSGSSAKTRVLLDHLYEPAAYVPIDIARDHL